MIFWSPLLLRLA